MNQRPHELRQTIGACNSKAVTEYKAGKEKAIGALVGVALKSVKADPVVIQNAIKQKLSI